MICNPSKVSLYNPFFDAFFNFNLILSSAFIFCFSSHLISCSFKSFLIIRSGTSTLPLFLLLNITSLRIDLVVNLNFQHFATLLALRSNFAIFLSAFKSLCVGNLDLLYFLAMNYLGRNRFLDYIALKCHQLDFHTLSL